MRYEMKSVRLILLHLAVCSIVITLSGCAMKTATAEEITIEGVYVKSLDHPFSGPAIMASGGYYCCQRRAREGPGSAQRQNEN